MKRDSLSELDTTDFDAAAELNSQDDVTAFLQACMDEAPEDAQFIAHALGVVARAKTRMASIAGQAGLSRESLYKALSGRRDPSLSTVLKVVSALGLRLQFALDERQISRSKATSVDTQTASSSARPFEVRGWSDIQRGDATAYRAASMPESFEIEAVEEHTRWIGTASQSLPVATSFVGKVGARRHSKARSSASTFPFEFERINPINVGRLAQ
ncbi:MAG: addiction module antidote protein [Rubrivivax sp.]